MYTAIQLSPIQSIGNQKPNHYFVLDDTCLLCISRRLHVRRLLIEVRDAGRCGPRMPVRASFGVRELGLGACAVGECERLLFSNEKNWIPAAVILERENGISGCAVALQPDNVRYAGAPEGYLNPTNDRYQSQHGECQPSRRTAGKVFEHRVRRWPSKWTYWSSHSY
jgi:hypothetical protein